MSQLSTARAAVVLLAVAAGVTVGGCATVTPAERATMMERAHTPEARAEYNRDVRAYQALRAN